MNKSGNHRGRARQYDYALIVHTFQELGNQRLVAQQLGMLQSTVSKILISQGIRVGKGRLPVHQLPMDEIADRYLTGESTIDLGQAYGVSPEVIRRRLRSHGTSRRGLVESRATGPKNAQWKGGKSQRTTLHYYRRQCYEVAAICFGQPLPQGWIIHHLDEDATHNAPTNLVVFRSQNDHARFHQQLRKTQRTGAQADATLLALGSGAVQLPQPPRPIVFEHDTDQLAPSEKPSTPSLARAAS